MIVMPEPLSILPAQVLKGGALSSRRHLAFELTNNLAGNIVITRLNTPSGNHPELGKDVGLQRSTAVEREAHAIADQIRDE